MTKTVEEVRRELFEAHIKTANPDDYAQDGDRLFQWNGASYAWTWVNWDWLLWNAALDAVEIQLPSERSLSASDDPWSVREWCIGAIEQTGLGLRIK